MQSGRAARSLFLRIKGGIEVCLPDSLKTMTTYTAAEQEDWFEDEIAFVRHLLRPGMRAVDIGANYGLYTLTMAKAVGPEGRVWCFEPASETAAFLRKSLDRNGFANVDLHQCALSDTPGQRRLKLESTPELNRLTSDLSAPGEDVSVETLDQLLAAAPPGPVDFVKIDAEGEESRIVAGGAHTLRSDAPVVMFERVHGATVDSTTMLALHGMGFALYRLVPGLNVLVPFEPVLTDRFQLNLFGVRPERAAALEGDGVLATGPGAVPNDGSWSRIFGDKPFFRAFAPQALAPPADAFAARMRTALDLYAAAMQTDRPAAARWAALRESAMILIDLVPRSPTPMRLFTLVRVAADMGLREIAVQALSRLPLEPQKYVLASVSEPFVPVCRRFDEIEPGAEFGTWCAVSVLEEIERLRSFSSYFAPDNTLPFLEAFRASPFFSPGLERRRQLIRIRTGRQAAPEFQPILAQPGPAHLNVAFWTARD